MRDLVNLTIFPTWTQVGSGLLSVLVGNWRRHFWISIDEENVQIEKKILFFFNNISSFKFSLPYIL